MKVITMCGSMRFAKEHQKVAEELEFKKGYCVIQCIYGENGKKYAKDEEVILDKIHKQKIDISDAIYIVNIGGYIGSSTKNEIEYAKKHGKEIIYHEKI